MQEIAQTGTSTMVPGLDLKKIRKTDETVPRVSVIDLITIVSKVGQAKKTWSDLKKHHSEVVTESNRFQNDWKFSGQGQNGTPVINATGAITIINLLPGQMAASFRAQWASIIVRYLGGDRTLIDEVEANHVHQQHLTNDDPQRFFGQTVERDGVIRRLRTGDYPKEAFTIAMTNQNLVQSGEVDLTAPQGYLGVAENVKVPPGIVPAGGIVGHFGCTHNEPTQRLMAHNGKFGFFRFVRHYPCANAYGLEQRWKAFLQIKGRIIPVLRADGNVDYESFWVHDLQEWIQFENEFQQMCDKLVDFICRTEEKRLDLKIKEAEIAISANEASKAHAEAEIERQKTIQIELQLGLRHGKSTTVPISNVVNETASAIDPIEDAESPRTSDITEDLRDDDPYSDYCLEALERCDMELWLQWTDLLADFRTWHDKRFPSRPLGKGKKSKDVQAIRKYFERKLGDIVVTQRKKQNVNGIFGWKLQSEFVADPEE